MDNFDVSMGANYLARVVDIMRMFILDTLGRFANWEQGLYQYEGMICIPDSNRPKTSKMQKAI